MKTNDQCAETDAAWDYCCWLKRAKTILPTGRKVLNVSGRQKWLAQGQKELGTYINVMSQAHTEVRAESCTSYWPSAHTLVWQQRRH